MQIVRWVGRKKRGKEKRTEGSKEGRMDRTNPKKERNDGRS